jgi:hypothetical protein
MVIVSTSIMCVYIVDIYDCRQDPGKMKARIKE